MYLRNEGNFKQEIVRSDIVTWSNGGSAERWEEEIFV